MTTDLAKLAQEINATHGEYEKLRQTGLAHARRVGLLLIDVRKLLTATNGWKANGERGAWQQWIEKNCSFGLSTALRYVRVASRWEEIGSDAETLSEAIAELGGRQNKGARGTVHVDSSIFDHVEAMRHLEDIGKVASIRDAVDLVIRLVLANEDSQALAEALWPELKQIAQNKRRRSAQEMLAV